MHATTDNLRRAAMTAALLHRADSTNYPLPQNHPGRDFYSSSLMQIARDCLHAAGVSTHGLNRSSLAIRALSTSDLPSILANVASKSLRRGYELAPRTFEPIATKVFAPDFKEVSRAQLGDAPQLHKVMEGGEYIYGTVTDEAEKYRLVKYGKILPITWEVVINDDLQAISRIPTSMGAAARQLESEVFWNEVTSNPAMADGSPVFSEAHRNVAGVGEEISITSIGQGRAAMRSQKTPAGHFTAGNPAYLVVPTSLETRAEQFVARPLVAQAPENVNPFAGRLQVISDPRLDQASETAWYLWADPALVESFEYCYLQGEEGPQIETRENFDTDSLGIKVKMAFAVKAIEHRGVYRNPGA